jgi:hypothetical protein
MAQENTNQPADDDFDDPQTEFLSVDDLDGRAVLVYPKSVQDNLPSNRAGGKPYSMVIADVVVLDGPVADRIPTVPFIARDMHISNAPIVPRIRQNVGVDKPIIGRIDSRPSSQNAKLPVYGLAKLDPADPVREVAVKARDMYRAERAANVGTDPTDPFASPS